MSRYRITPEARADLREIYRFIARDNRPAAIRMQERFIERFKQLARHPHSGHRERIWVTTFGLHPSEIMRFSIGLFPDRWK